MAMTRYKEAREAAETVRNWQDAGLEVVFTNGVFDILHIGHIRYLQQSKALGDKLVIGLNSDASVRRLKGETRPVHTLADRAEVLSALACVDLVTSFAEDTPLELITLLLPDILTKGGDYTIDRIVGADIVQNQGGAVHSIDFVSGYSTTDILNK